MELLQDHAITLLIIYSKTLKSESQKCTSTSIFIAAVFIIAKIWKQSMNPLTDEQINYGINT